MSQPLWKYRQLKNDNRLLCVDHSLTRRHCPEILIAEEINDTDPSRFAVFRVPLERLQLGADGRLVDVIDGKGQPHTVWFEDDVHNSAKCGNKPGPCATCHKYISHSLTAAAETAGVYFIGSLRKQFCASNVLTRWRAYEVVAGYHGWMPFDPYSKELTEEDFEHYWALLPREGA